MVTRRLQIPLVVIVFLLSGCGKEQEQNESGKSFNANASNKKAINTKETSPAKRFDKGNETTTKVNYGSEKPHKAIHIEETSPAQRFDRGNKWAVLIGVNKYLDSNINNLKYCVSDVRLMEKVLIEKCGYDKDRILVIADDQQQDHLRPLLINLEIQIRNWLSNARKGDTVLVFFSGHGFLDKQLQGYLAPKDCQLANLALGGFRTDELRNKLKVCQASQKILILDCCHSGAKGDQAGPSSEEIGASFKQAEGLITLASSRKKQESQEWGKKKQGLFTYFLAEGLGGKADKDKNGVVDSDEIYNYLYRKVSVTAQKELNKKQTPVRIIGGDVVGLFGLSRVSNRPVRPVVMKPKLSVPAPMPPQTAQNPSLLIAPFTKQEATAKQQEWAKHLGKQVIETNSIGMKMALIPPGEFMMGIGQSANEVAKLPISTEKYFIDELQHRVRLTKPFYLSTTEVTQKQWKSVMGTTPWRSGKKYLNVYVKEGDDYPATYVSWHDAQEFIKKLNQKEGLTYRLLTEAEWEYSCRAGSESIYSFGRSKELLKDYAWIIDNTFREKYSHQVGRKKTNSFGLYDMHGNVWEWCHDWYDINYYKQFANKVAIDPPGPQSESTYRVVRGGSWNFSSRSTRSAFRGRNTPALQNADIGFRISWTPNIYLFKTSPKYVIKLKPIPTVKPIVLDTPIELLVSPFSKKQAEEKQAAWAKHLNKKVIETNSIGIKMVLIPPGKFKMGSVNTRGTSEKVVSDSHPQHNVWITKPFYLAATEVTQKQWKSVMGSLPREIVINVHAGSKYDNYTLLGDDYPVTYVSWKDTQEFIKKLNKKEGVTYRLPTEAEWEYACRSGNESSYSFYPLPNRKFYKYKYIWYDQNTRYKKKSNRIKKSSLQYERYPHKAGLLLPNRFGLHDMHGNVKEWCSDFYDKDYYKQFETKTYLDPQGPKTKSDYYVLRGGSWYDAYDKTSSEVRDKGRSVPKEVLEARKKQSMKWNRYRHIFHRANKAWYSIGFRVARTQSIGLAKPKPNFPE